MSFNSENHNQPSTPNQLNPSLQALPLKKRKHSIECNPPAIPPCILLKLIVDFKSTRPPSCHSATA
jgi:hypothetical protein